MNAVANAAVPVAVGLIMLAAIARGVLEYSDDEQANRPAREYLEPLTTWCLVAVFVYIGARAAAGDIGIGSVVLAALIGGSAVALRDSTQSTEPEPEPEAVYEEPTAPTRATGPLWYGRY